MKSNSSYCKLVKTNILGYGAHNAYMYSFFYATATLTSAGFGDFSPQNRSEMLWAMLFQLGGFFLIGYYTSLLTSALSCYVRPRVALQQRLVSLRQFMNYYHVREKLQKRVIEHFVLQYQFRSGIILKRGQYLLYDAPSYLRNDVLYLEVCEFLDGVPIFSKLGSDVIIHLSRVAKRFLLPPNTTFLRIGEVRRTLYIIKLGSMGIFADEEAQPIGILEATTHFGVRDLLFGEPTHYSIRSLSYVSMYSINLKAFEDVLENEEEMWELIREERERLKPAIREMSYIYSSLGSTALGGAKDKAKTIKSWITMPSHVKLPLDKVLSEKEENRIQRINLLHDEYEQVFNSSRRLWFFKWFLLRRTIHPVGKFSKIWNCLMSLICCLTVITLMLETFCYMRMPWFRAIQICLDLINYVDIYLKLHWCYYNPNNGVLISHPLKTALNYLLNGSLVLDVAICAPVELLIWLLGLTNFLGYGEAATWYSKLRWVRFFQFKRIPIVFKIIHNIFTRRSILLLTLYVTTTLFLCTILSALAQFIACPWEANDWREGDENRIPMCQKDSWVTNKFPDADTNPEVISDVFRRWVLGVYYVIPVVLAIGYGDMITLGKADVIILIFLMNFGFLFMRCVIADVTAAEVDSDEARTKFIENMKVLELIMKRENVPKMLSNAVIAHLHHTWYSSRGLQPRELFSDLHPVLESELYKNLVGEKLNKVPIFQSFPSAVLRSACRYMKTYHLLRGERIMRYGNLEYEMCIILAGKVYITDQHLNYICTLGPGQSFGETNLIFSTARRHNAIAACNTKIYCFSASRFATFVRRYPNFKIAMEVNLAPGERDCFEKSLDRKMEKARALRAEEKVGMLNVFALRSSAVKTLIAQKEDWEQSGLNIIEIELQKSKSNKICGRGTQDENLPFLYFATTGTTLSSKRARWLNWPVIHPNCRSMIIFRQIIIWMCVLTPAIAAYEVCFSKEFLHSYRSPDTPTIDNYEAFYVSKTLHWISEAIEIMFLFNLLLQFFLAFEVIHGIYNKDPKSIALRYVTALDGFVFDLIGCCPFLLEKLFYAGGHSVDHIGDEAEMLDVILENLYLLRCIRLYHYYHSQLNKRDDLGVSTFRLQITLSVTSFCLMAHFLACLFYGISPCRRPDLTNLTFEFSNYCPPPEEGLDRNGWTTQYVIVKHIQTDKDRLQAWRWWFRSLYWVVTTISTTGFGDIVPVTIKEMIVAVICIFCGAFILSIILSQFTSGMSSLGRTYREYMYQVQLLLKHLKNIGLSGIRQTQVMMYFLTLWERCRGQPYHQTWRILPVSLQIEVAYALFGSTLLKVPFFRDNQEKIFIRQLCHRVTHSLYIPGVYIHKDGTQGSSLFVVYKGVVSGSLNLPNGNPDLISIYKPGDAFGRFTAFFHDGVYKRSYRAETMVEVLEVKQRDILHLTRKFPRFRRTIQAFIKSRYSKGGSHTNVFDKRRKNAQIFDLGTELFNLRVSRENNNGNVKTYAKKKKKIYIMRKKNKEVKIPEEVKSTLQELRNESNINDAANPLLVEQQDHKSKVLSDSHVVVWYESVSDDEKSEEPEDDHQGSPNITEDHHQNHVDEPKLHTPKSGVLANSEEFSDGDPDDGNPQVLKTERHREHHNKHHRPPSDGFYHHHRHHHHHHHRRSKDSEKEKRRSSGEGERRRSSLEKEPKVPISRRTSIKEGRTEDPRNDRRRSSMDEQMKVPHVREQIRGERKKGSRDHDLKGERRSRDSEEKKRRLSKDEKRERRRSIRRQERLQREREEILEEEN